MPVVQQVANQQMSHDTIVVNVTMEMPANVSNSNVVQTQQTQPEIIYVDDFGNRINQNSYDPNYYGTPVRNLNAFMTANQNVVQQCGAYDGNMWSDNCNSDLNQNYVYPNASFSNTASLGNPSAGASLTIAGSATTVLMASNGSVFGWYDSNGYYHGNSFGGQRQNNNNNNNRGIVMQPRRGVNQMQNNQQQNQNQRIAENRNAKPYDGNMW